MSACYPGGVAAVQPGETKPRRGGVGAHVAIPRAAPPPARPIPAALAGSIRRVQLPPGRKLVALTLDLCEQPGEVAGYDAPVFDYLRRENIKATIFAGGKWLVTHPGRTHELMADPLFEIASHGWHHRNMRGLTGAALAEEIGGPVRAYAAARAELAAKSCIAARPDAGLSSVPDTMPLFRFPFGACNPAALSAVAAAGQLAIQWDVSTGDPSPQQSAAAIASVMVRSIRPGSIVLAHANGRGHNTAAALPLAIPKLKAMGFEFVTVSELLAAGRPEIAQTCYDQRPGDTDRYDVLFAGRRAVARPGQHVE
jgi:peptidoglycan/xylan/chitin deacetylase (PgdA/CDA1 family)